MKSDINFIIVIFASKSPCSVNDQINFISSSVNSLFFSINSSISFDFVII